MSFMTIQRDVLTGAPRPLQHCWNTRCDLAHALRTRERAIVSSDRNQASRTARQSEVCIDRATAPTRRHKFGGVN